MQLAAFDGPSPKTTLQAQKSKKKISYASRVKAIFVPNFVAMATGVGREIIQLAAFDGPSPKTPPIGAKTSYGSKVIAIFVPNFVAMATGVSPGKMQLAAFDGLSSKTPL